MLTTIIALFLATTATAPGTEANENRRTNEVAVGAVSSGFVEAWNRHDMRAFANLFAEDADFVNVIGMWWRGRGEIQKEHEALHATRMKNSHLTALDTAVRFLGPNVAIVHVRWELSGDTGLEGKPLPPRRGFLTHVVAKSANGWFIASSQNTDVVPLPNVPGPR